MNYYMVKKEILEGNKLIAEFIDLTPHDMFPDELQAPDEFKWMAVKINVESDYDKLENEFISFENYFKFHSSWDWLMPVVEKIMQISNNTFWRYSDIIIKKDSCELWIGQHIKSPVIGLHVIVSSDWNGYKHDNCLHIFKKHNGSMYCIDYCYIAIIEFIKWYNLCQKKNKSL